MNIVYACDDKFVGIMGISITSLFEMNKDVLEIIVYVIEDLVSNENKDRLQKLALEYNRTIIFIPLKSISSCLVGLCCDRGGESQFSRLFLSKVVPESCDRVLYMDCDTLIRGSLADLYSTDFEGNVICGVLDCISKQHRARIHISPEEIYINSGILLIDMFLWRNLNIENKITNIIQKYEGRVPYADQGIVNLALMNKIKLVHPRYNCMSIFTVFNYDELLEFRQPSACESSFKIKEARENPTIVHYVTLFCLTRPWVKGGCGPYYDEWRACKARSLWADEPLCSNNKRKYLRFLSILYRKLPRWMTLPIIGFLHSRVKPILLK